MPIGILFLQDRLFLMAIILELFEEVASAYLAVADEACLAQGPSARSTSTSLCTQAESEAAEEATEAEKRLIRSSWGATAAGARSNSSTRRLRFLLGCLISLQSLYRNSLQRRFLVSIDG